MKAILAFLVVFTILVVIHEFGHYWVAKRSGVLVREFAIGFGPKLISWRREHTTFTIRWLPFGGYVRMAGAQEDDDDEIKPGQFVLLKLNEANEVVAFDLREHTDELAGVPLEVSSLDLEDNLVVAGTRAQGTDLQTFSVAHDAVIIEKDGTAIQIAPRDVQLQSASVWARMAINFAGPFNNIVLALISFVLVGFLLPGIPTGSNQIGQVVRQSAAAQAGLKSGDRITKMNQQQISNWNQLVTTVQKAPGKSLKVTYHRGEHQYSTVLTPKVTRVGKNKIGTIGVAERLDSSLPARLKYGATTTWQISYSIFNVLGSFLHGGFSLNKLSGPVGIYQATSRFVNSGLISMIGFLGMLSINLAIFNLIPIPGLDGGKILLNIVEAIRRKPLDPDKEGLVTLAGAALLLALMIAVTWNDIVKLFIH